MSDERNPTYNSALIVLEEAIKHTDGVPTSYIDIGCHDGIWLLAVQIMSQRHIVTPTILGVDIRPDPLYVRPADYLQKDITKLRPGELQHGWDLCLCMEVAEHLRRVHATQLVELLCSLSSQVLFSAAHPGQGPYDPDHPENFGAHWNEQPKTYWRQLFAQQNYHYVDLQPELQSKDVLPWYRLNTDLYLANT